MKVFFFSAVLLLTTVPAFSWSSTGHETIAQLAYQQLSPQTRLNVDAILEESGKNAAHVTNFVSAAVWPDDIRMSGLKHGRLAKEEEAEIFHAAFKDNNTWHYVDYPLDSQYALDGRYSRETDVVHIIGRCIDALENKATTGPWNQMTHKEALAWLIHLVGDIHQPLHVGAGFYQRHGYKAELIKNPPGEGSYFEDRGGNLLIYNGSSQNMHSFWDDEMVQVVASRGDLVQELSGKVKKASRNHGNYRHWPTVWAISSIKAAKIAYSDLRGFNFSPEEPTKVSCFKDANYGHVHRQLAERQLVNAARGLADLLNALDWPVKETVPLPPPAPMPVVAVKPVVVKPVVAAKPVVAKPVAKPVPPPANYYNTTLPPTSSKASGYLLRSWDYR